MRLTHLWHSAILFWWYGDQAVASDGLLTWIATHGMGDARH